MGAGELIDMPQPEAHSMHRSNSTCSPLPFFNDLKIVDSPGQSKSTLNSAHSPLNNDEEMAPVDEIVISGMSGRLPECDNLENFAHNLFNGIDMVTENSRRWPMGLYDLPKRSGTLKNMDHFDAPFFKVPHKQAHPMDPQLRVLHELTFEAIVDAGINPMTIRSTKTGVFIGTSWTEIEPVEGIHEVKGYTQQSSVRCMLANRLSFAFDFKGPSFTVDTACSSSLLALHQAVGAIQLGQCDAAIVGGINFCFDPLYCLRFLRLKILSPDGKCRSFDSSADGYARSEGAVILYIQKRPVAVRFYASILHIKTNTDGYKTQGPATPSRKMQSQLLRETYDEAGVNPYEVIFVEAHGTGTVVGDRAELNALEDIFSPGRSPANPLLIGAVKSNLGHTEPASGVISIVKVLLSMQRGIIPANLHYKNPNLDSPALCNGTFKMINEPTPFPDGGIVGVSSFGFGGVNVHAILKPNPKRISENENNSKLPLLIPHSGRTKESVEFALREVTKESKVDPNMLSMLHEIYKTNIPGHDFRGYALHPSEIQNIQPVNSQRGQRSTWFIFSGVGSQWGHHEMGRDLLKFPAFEQSLKKPAEVLKSVGLDLYSLLDGSQSTKNAPDLIETTVSIMAMQIGLVDLLRSVGVKPDGIIGHSVGEIGAAYADGCLTGEEAIMAAYARGQAVSQFCKFDGAMAAIGMTWQDAQAKCPSGVYPACHNGATNVTISGPRNDVHDFVRELEIQKIFARIIDSSGMAYHSKYIEEAGPCFKKRLDEIIQNPAPRSKKWASSSLTKSQREEPMARWANPDFFLNNFLSPVLFHDAIMENIPEDAVVIEIAAHGVLQPILRRSLPPSCLQISLMDKKSDNVIHFLNALGQLYNAGLNIAMSKLYENVQFPLALDTPLVSPLVQWDHSVAFYTPDFVQERNQNSGTIYEVTLGQGQDKFYKGHKLDGHTFFPATGYFEMVWQTFAKMESTTFDQLPVVFEDVKIIRAIILEDKIPVKFLVKISPQTGHYEVIQGGSAAASGIIRKPITNMADEMLDIEVEKNPAVELDSNDVYKFLRLRGHDYTGSFRSIYKGAGNGQWGQIIFQDSVTCFLDGVAQLYFFTLDDPGRAICLPTGLKKFCIDPKLLFQSMTLTPDLKKVVDVTYRKDLDVLKCPGIEVRSLSMRYAARRKEEVSGVTLMEKYSFSPFIDGHDIDPVVPLRSSHDDLIFCLDLAAKNSPSQFNILEISESESLRDTILKYFRGQVHKSCDLTSIQESELDDQLLTGKFNLVIFENHKILNYPANILESHSFILFAVQKPLQILPTNFIMVALKLSQEGQYFYLFRNIIDLPPFNDMTSIFIEIPMDWEWLEELKMLLNAANKSLNPPKFYLTSQTPPNGLVGFFNCLQLELGHKFRLYLNMDKTKFDFRQPDPELCQILANDLTFNVYKDGQWGSFCHFDLKIDEPKETQHANIHTTSTGDLSSLKWIENPAQKSALISPKFVQVEYAAVNYLDFLLATGTIPPESYTPAVACGEQVFGMEFSGQDSEGQRVMGLVECGAMTTKVIPHKLLTWPVPLEWSQDQAATIPLAYSLAYYALKVRGQVEEGESILIHLGASSVGQAAIAVAVDLNCQIFVTTENEDERHHLKLKFPTLTYFFNCTEFQQKIYTQTKGCGVSVILNLLKSPEQFKSSLKSLACGGRFLEFGQLTLDSVTGLCARNIQFHSINPLEIIRNSQLSSKIHKLVQQGLNSGIVKPLESAIFENSNQEIEKAFRLAGKSNLKILIKIPISVNAIPRILFSDDKSFVIIGGLGGFGLELAGWLISKNVKKLVLVSRSGITNGYQGHRVKQWRQDGVQVMTPTGHNVATVEGAENLLLEVIEQFGPIGGIFNLGMVLQDGFFENLDEEKFKQVALPKIQVTTCLDEASRKLATSLEYFVCFSSITSGRGNFGQSNYGFANSYMERLCEQRQRDGLPALAIQWGPIGDVGVLGELAAAQEIELGACVPQPVSSCLDTLEILLQNQDKNPVVASMTVKEKSNRRSKEVNGVTLSQRLGHILGLSDISSFNLETSLPELGLDSLMGMELLRLLERDFNYIVAPNDLRTMTLARVFQIEAEANSKLVKPDPTPKSTAPEKSAPAETETGLLPERVTVEMRSLSSNNSVTLFIVPPIQGHVKQLELLASHLGVKVIGLQCVKGSPTESVEKLAEYFFKEIKRVQPTGPYDLAGYSFGCQVTVALGLHLERENCVVRNLFFLDGSWCQTGFDLQSFEGPNDHLAALCCFLAQFLTKSQLEQIREELLQFSTLDVQVGRACQFLQSVHAQFSLDSIECALNEFMGRLKAGAMYRPGNYIHAKFILMKANDNPRADKFEHDYGLEKISWEKVEIHKVSGDHVTFTEKAGALEIAKIMTDYLKA